GYAGWTFYDAAALQQPMTRDLPDASTDAQGKTSFQLPDDLLQAGTARLSLAVEGLEAGGGRGVKANTRLLVSPLTWMLGWKTGSNLNFLRQNGSAELSLLAVKPDLSAAAPGQVTLRTLNVTYSATLFRDDAGQYRYDRLRQEKEASSKKAELGEKGLSVPLDLSTPGERILEVVSADGMVRARIPYTVAGIAAANFSEDRDPMLSAHLDKTDYNPGDTVEIHLSTPYSGTGLITIERDRVAAQQWFTANAGDTVQRISLPRDFEGRAYLNITYFRSLKDKDIFTKPLASAIVPFTVNMKGRDLGLSLKIAGAKEGALPVARPGSKLAVAIKAQKAGKALLFAVDEGILQMTAYKTPDPLAALLGNRALEVETSQLFDLLMPEYGLMKSTVSAFGGGESTMSSPLGQNPFRRRGEASAVFWSGIMDVGPSEKTVEIPVPSHFSGKWRVMAVAASGDSVSSAQASANIQAEVVMQPAVPVFAAPGDEFTAALTLTDMSGLGDAAKGRNLILSVDPGKGFALENKESVPLMLLPEKSQTIQLKLRALDVPGEHTLAFHIAPAANEKGNEVVRAIPVSIRPAAPLATKLMTGRLKGYEERSVALGQKVYPNQAKLTVSLSALPLPAAHGLSSYLYNYPYGCTEQTLSAAFPALVL
ncbi:MAG: alpha-2-macroglobulin family protein, partial [Desulfovibrionaceae bacterium]|nr:alpha-2-macroglobulin family protein [Desulfovibrionaceae bacterium]